MESNLIWMEYTLWKHGLSITDTLGLCYMNCRIFRKLGGFAVVDGQLVTGHEQFLATLLCNSISIIMRTLNSQDPQWALTGLSVCLEYERSRNLGRAASCPNLLSTFSSHSVFSDPVRMLSWLCFSPLMEVEMEMERERVWVAKRLWDWKYIRMFWIRKFLRWSILWDIN